ncbi:ankyrin repeat domain-containing protein [Saccharopolyspora sp. NPDC050642]|uniref:ankyrin repeat domain-containing protein n=1 Tax=Saccharopolyspora sp. NPDC050642 TaxID=3157099 RepID=UPI0033E6D0F1
MDPEEVLRCLAEADAGRLRPELCNGHYVLVEYTGEHDHTPFDEDELDDEFDDFEDDEDEDELEYAVGMAVGDASSMYEALDLLANRIDDVEDPEEHDQTEYRHPEAGVVESPGRRLVARLLDGDFGAMGVVTTGFWNDPYLGRALIRFNGARFAFLTSAAPPHQELAYAIVELQPTGTPTEQDRTLVDACRRGDVDAIAAAISAGANVNAPDERGMAPLHVAVAHRKPAAVAALLAAGARTDLQAEYGNAPHFAALDGNQRVKPCAAQIDDDDHRQILRALVEAGAPVNATSLTGATMLDLAIRSLPYPEGDVRFLVGRGAHSGELDGQPLHELLEDLPYQSARALRVRMNEVRFLLESGAEKEHALSALIGDTGYYEHEVPAETLLELVEVLLDHGAEDSPAEDRSTALENAESWVEHGLPNYQPVVDRLRAAR